MNEKLFIQKTVIFPCSFCRKDFEVLTQLQFRSRMCPECYTRLSPNDFTIAMLRDPRKFLDSIN